MSEFVIHDNYFDEEEDAANSTHARRSSKKEEQLPFDLDKLLNTNPNTTNNIGATDKGNIACLGYLYSLSLEVTDEEI